MKEQKQTLALSYVDEIDLLEIETGLFEARKLFERFRNEVYDAALMKTTVHELIKKDEFYLNLLSGYFDYLFIMSERLNNKWRFSKGGTGESHANK